MILKNLLHDALLFPVFMAALLFIALAWLPCYAFDWITGKVGRRVK